MIKTFFVLVSLVGPMNNAGHTVLGVEASSCTEAIEAVQDSTVGLRGLLVYDYDCVPNPSDDIKDYDSI